MSVSSDLSSWSLSSQASSSPEPSRCNNDALALIYEICDLANFPTNHEWMLTFGRQYVIHLLLEKACRAIKHGSTNQTVYKYIKDFAWPDVLEELAHLGATVADRNCRGDTAVHLAFVNGATDGRVFDSILQCYLDNASENLKNNDGLSFLHIACAKASADNVQRLLKRYPSDVNQQVTLNRVPFAGYTPLHFAVEFNRYEIVDLLLRNNADFCARDRLGITPLHLALYCSQGSDDTDIIDLILAYDMTNENCVDNFGLNHLMVACMGSRTSVVEKILQVEFNRNLPPSSLVKRRVMDTVKNPFGGYTPLHFAAQSGNLDTVHLLLGHGASTYALTINKYTPVALARLNNHNVVLRLLQHYSDRCNVVVPTMRTQNRDMATSRLCSAFVDLPVRVESRFRDPFNPS